MSLDGIWDFQVDTVACGVCSACVQRLMAFEEMGIPDPLPYRQ
jgi:7-cyano-7-deazaguanine synthase in queuosine biosynthesis